MSNHIQEGGTAGADRSLSFACEVLDTASLGGFVHTAELPVDPRSNDPLDFRPATTCLNP
jgi:hypothetical protein